MRAPAIALLLGAGPTGAVTAARDGQPDCASAEPAARAATEALDEGRWADAERLLQPLASSRADCGRVVVGLARLRAARGEAAEAERLFERALTLAPRDALVHALFAQHLLSGGRHARADYLAALALAMDPECADALVVQGRILRGKGRMPEAREAVEKALRVDPTNTEASFQLGVWLFGAKLHADAARQFESVVAARSGDARAHDYLALCLEALGEAERAELAYRAALKVNEGPFFDAMLDYNYGRFLLKQNRLDESRAHLDRAITLLPERRPPHYERGKLNLARGDFSAARRDAERALSLPDPSGLVLDLQVYYMLATVYSRLGESELARKYAELARSTPIPDQVRDRRE
jgi:tetratricopeptide (TPR) repeat protein